MNGRPRGSGGQRSRSLVIESRSYVWKPGGDIILLRRVDSHKMSDENVALKRGRVLFTVLTAASV